jgi:hypothetical protein
LCIDFFAYFIDGYRESVTFLSPPYLINNIYHTIRINRLRLWLIIKILESRTDRTRAKSATQQGADPIGCSTQERIKGRALTVAKIRDPSAKIVCRAGDATQRF